jgi:hypothetical protein
MQLNVAGPTNSFIGLGRDIFLRLEYSWLRADNTGLENTDDLAELA